MVSAGMRFPLTSRAVVDEQEFLELIDQLRTAVPQEIKQAKRVSQEVDRVLYQAQVEADKLINEARDRASMLLQDQEIVRNAQIRAEAINTDAERHAAETRRGADEYALQLLNALDEEMTRSIAGVRKGRAQLARLIEAHEVGSDLAPVGERTDLIVE
jgi:cell division septum initiation protein DivIVA